VPPLSWRAGGVACGFQFGKILPRPRTKELRAKGGEHDVGWPRFQQGEALPETRGRQKKVGDPRGGWVGGSEAKKGLGSDFFPRYFFYRVFELPSPRNAQKRDKKKSRKNRFGIFCQMFFVVFLNSHRRKTPDNAIKQKKVEEKLTSKYLSIFLEKDFDMDFLQTNYGVFELPLPRNAQKRTKKNQRKWFSGGGWVGLGFSEYTGGSVEFFWWPLVLGSMAERAAWRRGESCL
jgi:hypothetical protein